MKRKIPNGSRFYRSFRSDETISFGQARVINTEMISHLINYIIVKGFADFSGGILSAITKINKSAIHTLEINY